MKILSRMLSKKIEPQSPDEMEFRLERESLDDAGQVRPSRPRSRALDEPVSAKPEEPEVAGSGWATEGDWDDDWDDDEDWGDEDDPTADIETRRATQDKAHLVSEIRDAMTSVGHVDAQEKSARRSVAPSRPAQEDKRQRSEWSEDEDFGRQARARSELTEGTEQTEERLMEQTENVMSESSSVRRRSALAHMKAAAAATKADRVLRHVATHDAAADSEEQSPYRDDLAKVVRPHSTSRPISRQVSRTDAPTPIWDQGAGDEDAALFAAAENGLQDDPETSVNSEMSAAEELRLARAPTELSATDFAGDDDESETTPVALRDFPSSRFAISPAGADEGERNAFDDFESAADDIAAQSQAVSGDDFDDPFEADDPFGDDEFEDDFDDDDGPQPSSAVAEAVAFANAPDEVEAVEEPEELVRKKIWEMADEVASEVESKRAMMRSQPRPEAEDYAAPEQGVDAAPAGAPMDNMVEVSAAAIAGRAGRSAGRVKTRLLGFQAEDDPKDVFASETEGRAPVVADKFPTGWIVVIDGPGRGSSFSLHAGVSQIGRGEDQTVRLDFGDTSISRNNHAAVAFDEEQGTFFLGHGGKSNLVRLNGKPVLSTEEMTDGDEIRIGETSLKFIALCGENFTWNGHGDSGENA